MSREKSNEHFKMSTIRNKTLLKLARACLLLVGSRRGLYVITNKREKDTFATEISSNFT